MEYCQQDFNKPVLQLYMMSLQKLSANFSLAGFGFLLHVFSVPSIAKNFLQLFAVTTKSTKAIPPGDLVGSDDPTHLHFQFIVLDFDEVAQSIRYRYRFVVEYWRSNVRRDGAGAAWAKLTQIWITVV